MKKILFILLFTLLMLQGISAVTPDGSEPAGDNMLIFVTLMFIVSLIGLFYLFFDVLVKLTTIDVNTNDVLINWVFYILLIITYHFTAHYVEDVFMYNLSGIFITVTTWSNAVFPAFAFAISFILRMLNINAEAKGKSFNIDHGY